MKLKRLVKISLKFIFKLVNKVFPKDNDRVFIEGSPTSESSSLSVANYIASNYDLKVVYIVMDKSYNLNNLLHKSVRKVNKYSWLIISTSYVKEFIRSKYIIYTHGTFIENDINKQVTVNMWHGITYKKIGVLIGSKPFNVNITLGTSNKTREMFSEVFGVDKKSVFISGYPRNDYLLNSDRESIIEKVNPKWHNKKILFWLPTYRKNKFDLTQTDGKEVGNPFFIENFKLDFFDNLLKDLNVICLLKPHPNSPPYEMKSTVENIQIINDHWINSHDLNLYQFMSVTDMLISDVSSVMLDYLFLDKPIICMSSDLEIYDQTRGLYFEDTEKWIPGPIIKEQEDLFNTIKAFIKEDTDEFEEKREKLKKIFFKYHDDKSTERLVKHIFGYDSEETR